MRADHILQIRTKAVEKIADAIELLETIGDDDITDLLSEAETILTEKLNEGED
jgi:hypothetical protein